MSSAQTSRVTLSVAAIIHPGCLIGVFAAGSGEGGEASAASKGLEKAISQRPATKRSSNSAYWTAVKASSAT